MCFFVRSKLLVPCCCKQKTSVESPQTGNSGGERGRNLILSADPAICIFAKEEPKLNQQPSSIGIS